MYNPKMAIDVVKFISNQNIDVHMFMVGPDKDNLQNDLNKYCKKNKVDQLITFTGRLKTSEWVELSYNCNFFINTTFIDNTPLSVVESMALGFPVISTDVGGLPYLIENEKNGFLVEKGDYKSMAKIIISLKSDITAYRKIQKMLLIIQNYMVGKTLR